MELGNNLHIDLSQSSIRQSGPGDISSPSSRGLDLLGVHAHSPSDSDAGSVRSFGSQISMVDRVKDVKIHV